MIKLTDVSKKFSKFEIKDMTLEIPDGYVTGLIGLNGAGKTTLFHLILGLYKAEKGEITMDGMSYQTDERKIRELFGTVLQERLFEDYLTLTENATLYGRYYKNYDAKQMEDLMEEFELDAKQKYKTLSKGEELKFQFAFALAHQPKILLLDEPTGNFDPDFRDCFWEKINAFISDGEHSVVLATHLTDDLDRMADYLIYLEDGKVLMNTDVESMRSEYRIIQGENYKVKLFQAEYMIAMEEGTYGGKALVRHKKRFDYSGLTVSEPTIEELMYFMTKRKNQKSKRAR